jgi:hypothetical protein
MKGGGVRWYPLPAATPPPLAPDLWAARSRRYRREVADYCELCWYPGPRPFLWGWIGDKLQVHHCDSRGIRSPLGQEVDAELMTLCRPCHQSITRKHQALGRKRGQMAGRDPLGYSHTIREVTDAARPRWVRRRWHQFLYGRPT